MLDEDLMSWIPGSCNCDDGGDWVTKIAAKKIELWLKKSKTSVRFFQPQFLSLNLIPFPSQSLQDPRICDIELSSNIFWNLLITVAEPLKKQYREFEGPSIVMGVKGGVTKIAAKKVARSSRQTSSRLT